MDRPSIDNRWEYEAPQFVDFNIISDPDEDSNASQYFDRLNQDGKENGLLSDIEHSVCEDVYKDSSESRDLKRDDVTSTVQYRPGNQNVRQPGRTLRSGRITSGSDAIKSGNANDKPAKRLFVVSTKFDKLDGKTKRGNIDKKYLVDKQKRLKELKTPTAARNISRTADVTCSPSTKRACHVSVNHATQKSSAFDTLHNQPQSRLSNRSNVSAQNDKRGRKLARSHLGPMNVSSPASAIKSKNTAKQASFTKRVPAIDRVSRPNTRSSSLVDRSLHRDITSSSTIKTNKPARRSKSLFFDRTNQSHTIKSASDIGEAVPDTSPNAVKLDKTIVEAECDVDLSDSDEEDGFRENFSERCVGEDVQRESKAEIEGKMSLSNFSTSASESQGQEAHAVQAQSHSLNMEATVLAAERKLKFARPKPNLTIANTPQLLRRNTKPSRMTKTHEQMEMEKIAILRRTSEQIKLMAQKSLQVALAPPVTRGRGVIRLTRPTEFHFAVDERLGKGKHDDAAAKNIEPANDGNFEAGLRKHPRTKCAANRITQVEPFNLAHGVKRRHEDIAGHSPKPSGYKFQTLGEKIWQFTTKTPQRFHIKNPKAAASPRIESMPMHVTLAKTPKLATRRRAAAACPSHVMSREELEELELEEMKRNQFKAHPINNKVLTRQLCAKPVPAQSHTVFEPFDLAPDKRMQPVAEREQATADREARRQPIFHANPVPETTYQPPAKLVTEKHVTTAKSPAFTLRSRGNQSRGNQSQMSQIEMLEIRAKPAPKFGEPFRPQLEQRSIEPIPFSFEHKTAKMVEHKNQLIEKTLEEERKAREFTANELPDFELVVLPEKKLGPTTDVMPFTFRSDMRCSERAKKFEEQIQEEIRQQREKAIFIANPPTVLQQQPFEPIKSSHTITMVPFELKTGERAEKWKEFEEWKRREDEKKETEWMEREARRAKEEEENVQRQRKEAVHIAQPIRRYKSVDIHPSAEPLTSPHSPNFSDRLRSKPHA